MFSHIMVGANDLATAQAFYDSTFAVLGFRETFHDHKGRIFWTLENGNFAITTPINGDPATSGNGSTIGFSCNSPAIVDAWYSEGLAHGGQAAEDAPGMRDEGTPMARYIAYLRDPSGNKLCAMHFMGRNSSRIMP